MKFTVTAEKLSAILAAIANPPGESSQQLDSLAVILTADAFGCVTVRRTTAISTIETDLEAELGDDGECAVNYGMLQNAVNDLGGDIVFEHKGNDLHFRAGKDTSKVACLMEAETLARPEFPEIVTEIFFESGDLKNWIGVALPAASRNEAEPNFRGVCIREQQGQITIFGIDGRRLHLRFCGLYDDPICPDGKPDAGVLLPPETAQALLRLLTSDGAKVKLGISKRALVYECGATKALLPLSEGKPPSILPFTPWGADTAPAECAAVVDREKLLKAVRGAAVLGYGDTRVVTLCFGKDTLEVEGDTETGAVKRRVVDAEVTGQAKRVVRLSGAYFAELLDAAHKPQVTIELIEGKPMVAIRDDCQILVGMLVRDHKVNVG